MWLRMETLSSSSLMYKIIFVMTQMWDINACIQCTIQHIFTFWDFNLFPVNRNDCHNFLLYFLLFFPLYFTLPNPYEPGRILTITIRIIILHNHTFLHRFQVLQVKYLFHGMHGTLFPQISSGFPESGYLRLLIHHRQ